MVIADTSVWIGYFRGHQEPVQKALRALIQAKPVALVGVVLGELFSLLRRKGIILPLSDLIIAAIGLEHDCQVFALDPHFKRIPGLKLYPFSPSSPEQ